MPKLHNIEAQAHMELKNGGFRVKVSILDLGMYINGFVVFPPNGEHKEWAVYPPKQNVYGRWIGIVEFNMKEMLWLEIYEACVAAGQLFAADIKDVVIMDIGDEPINLDHIKL